MPTEILSSCQHRSTQFQRQVHLFGCLFKESIYQSTKLQFVIQFVQGTGKTFIKETLNQILNKARSDTNKTTKKLFEQGVFQSFYKIQTTISSITRTKKKHGKKRSQLHTRRFQNTSHLFQVLKILVWGAGNITDKQT